MLLFSSYSLYNFLAIHSFPVIPMIVNQKANTISKEKSDTPTGPAGAAAKVWLWLQPAIGSWLGWWLTRLWRAEFGRWEVAASSSLEVWMWVMWAWWTGTWTAAVKMLKSRCMIWTNGQVGSCWWSTFLGIFYEQDLQLGNAENRKEMGQHLMICNCVCTWSYKITVTSYIVSICTISTYIHNIYISNMYLYI